MKIKRILVSTLFILFITLGFVACKKEVSQELVTDNATEENGMYNKSASNSFGLSTDGNILVFNTISDFDKLSEEPEKMEQGQEEAYFSNLEKVINSLTFPKFKSSKTYLNMTVSGADNNYPSLLLQILNDKGVVQIGSFIYRLDFGSKLVYVIAAKAKLVAYNDLLAGNVTSYVKQFTWDNQVVDIMENRFVKEGMANSKKHVLKMTDAQGVGVVFNGNLLNQTATATLTGKHYSSVLKARYRWSPICWDLYCKLVVKETTTELTVDDEGNISSSSSTNLANVPVRLEWQRSYKIRNRDLHGYQSNVNGGTGKAVGQSYQGGRALSKFILGANAYIKVDNVWCLMNFADATEYVNGTAYQVRINDGF